MVEPSRIPRWASSCPATSGHEPLHTLPTNTGPTGERSDGIDGGAIITADLDLSGERLRLATLHQGFDEFTDDADLRGIDAAVQALGTVAARVKEELAVYTHAMGAPRLAISPATGGHTVLGVWIGDEPVPVGVVRGQHQVSGGDKDRFPEGLWATSMPADDPDVAEQEAVAQMCDTLAP